MFGRKVIIRERKRKSPQRLMKWMSHHSESKCGSLVQYTTLLRMIYFIEASTRSPSILSDDLRLLLLLPWHSAFAHRQRYMYFQYFSLVFSTQKRDTKLQQWFIASSCHINNKIHSEQITCTVYVGGRARHTAHTLGADIYTNTAFHS